MIRERERERRLLKTFQKVKRNVSSAMAMATFKQITSIEGYSQLEKLKN